MNEQRLDLKGLVFVFAGSLITLVASLIEGALNSQNVGSSLYGMTTQQQNPIVSVLSVVGFVLTVVGIVKLRKISKHFANTLKYLIIEIVLVIVVTLLLTGMLAMTDGLNPYSSSMSEHAGALLVLALVMLVVSVVLLIIALLFFREFVYGLAEIPDRANDIELRDKCIKLWSSFKIAVILFAVGAIVLVIGYSMTSRPLTLVGVIAALVGAIWMFVIEIQRLIRIMKVYKKYDGALISRVTDQSYAAPYTGSYEAVPAYPAEPAAPVESRPADTDNVFAKRFASEAPKAVPEEVTGEPEEIKKDEY